VKILEANLHSAYPMTGSKKGRLPFLDWMRGVAAIIMLQGHTFHSFATAQTRNEGPYNLSQFFGGIGPAIFLFLTGVTFSFIMHGGERKSLSGWSKWTSALRRARYLFILAFLFRFQMWAFSLGQSPWTDLLKVDVLNCMGLTMFVLAPLALGTLFQRALWSAVFGTGIAVLSPVVSMMDWTWLPGPVAEYFVPSLTRFAIFPWAAFIAFGVSFGCLLKMAKADDMNRLMQWSALTGFGLLLSAQYFSNFPYSIYPKSDFWLNSPSLVFSKLGVLLLFASLAYLWVHYVVADRWSWVMQLGTTSLLVYWLHIEIVYGRWFGFWKDQLNAAECAVYSIFLILVMIGLSVLRTRMKRMPLPQWLAWRYPVLSHQRVSGD
jgi:uncharacterized membrane protein